MSDATKAAISTVKRMTESTICKRLLENFDIEADPEDFTKDQLVELYMVSQAEFFKDEPDDSGKSSDNAADSSAADSDKKMHEKITINIAKEKDEPLYVDVSVNGKAFRIKRGMDVQVPRYIYETLVNGCVQTFYEHDSETGENSENNQPRFNIQVKI